MHSFRLLSLPKTLLFLSAFVASEHLGAQITSYEMTTPAIASGPSLPVPYDGADDKVNLSNGNLSINIPLLTLPGRGGNNLTIGISHDSQTYHLQTGAFYTGLPYPQPTMAYGVGYQPADSFPTMPGNAFWRLQIPTLIGYRELEGLYPYCSVDGCAPAMPFYCDHFAYLDWDGTRHDFGNGEFCFWDGYDTGFYYPGNGQPGPAAGAPLPIHVNYITGTTYGKPGLQSFSGFLKLDTTNTSDAVVTERDGTQVHFNLSSLMNVTGQYLGPMPFSFTKIVDRNGNITTLTVTTGQTTSYLLTDTLGRQVTIDSTGVTYPDDTIPAPSTRHIAFGPGPTPAPSSLSLSVSGCELNYEYESNSELGSNSSSVSGTAGITTAVTFPNNEVITFGNDALGELSFIQYGEGGYKRFVYSTETIAGYGDDPNNPVECSSANTRQVTGKFECTTGTCGCMQSSSTSACAGESRTVYTPTPVTPAPVTEEFGGNQQNVVQAYDFNQNLLKTELHSFTFECWYVPLETSSQLSNGQGNLIRTTTTSYSNNCLSPASVITTYNDVSPAISSTVSYSYPSISFSWEGSNQTVTFDKPTSATYADFTGSVLKTEGTPLLWQSNSAYGVGGSYLLDLISSSSVSGGGASANTTYGYDEYGLQPSNVSVQHTTGASPPGNQTSVHRSLNGSTINTTNCPITINNGYAVSHKTYFDTGTEYQFTDPCGSQAGSSSHTFTYSYSSSYAGAYPTTITNPAGQAFNYAYDFSSGALTSLTDPNSQQTTATYVLGRLTQVNYPDGGQTNYCYTDVGGTCSQSSPPLQIVSTKKITPSLNKISTTVFDGFGRPSQTQLNSDTPSATYTLTQYDALGRKSQVYNPTRCSGITTNCGETTWGYTTYQYDPLDRVTSVTEQDGSVVATSYSGNCSTVTDEANKSRKSCSDALGRLTGVWEDPAVLNYETDYQYDGLTNLLNVTQKGGTTTSTMWRSRNFVYDSLSRLTSASNPEAGTISYGYDADNNLITKTAPSPNQQPTGTATVTTTYNYDVLNRLIGKSYHDTYTQNSATPSASYAYDGNTLTGCIIAPPGLADSYPIGHRTSMCDGSDGTSWAYDTMGRVLQERRTINTVKGDYENDAFNLDGSVSNVTSLGYGIGYSYSGAARPLSVTHSSINFVKSGTYAPPGELTGGTLGSATGFAGFTIANAFNSRLQPILLSAGVSGQSSVFSECFDFHLATAVTGPAPCSFSGTTAGDNGNVYQIVNNRVNTRSQSFNYDSLNRIANGQSSGTQWGEAYSTDAWGNMTAISSYQGKPAESLTTSASSNNQLVGLGYDAAGNLISSGSTSYVYDAENRLIWTNSSSGYRYLYDGNGERVEKCVAATSTTACPTSGTNGTLYWKGPGSNTLSETDLSGNVLNTYIFFNGQRIARNDSAGAIHYYFSDHLGSHGVVENATGSVCEQDIDYYPYGGVQYDYCHNAPQNYKFTGKERDAESGLDNFGARYYGSSLGRFMQTDPIWVKADRMLDPQRLNLYSYVRNNPLTLTDPSGMDVVLRTCSGSSTMTQCFNQVQNGLKKEDRSHVHLVEGDGKNGFKKGQYGITVDADYKGSAGNFSTLQKLANDHSATANVDVLKPTDSFNVRISVSYNAKSGLGNLSTSSMTANDFEGYTFSLQGRTRRNRSLLTKTRMS